MSAIHYPVAEINLLARYLACDDSVQANPAQANLAQLLAAVGEPAPDLLILLGNAILTTCESAFTAVANGTVKKLLIAGGIGHSTELLYRAVARDERYHQVATHGRSEADILHTIAVQYWHLTPEQIMVENRSTNCGDNARQARQVLDAVGYQPHRIILTQDPLMQRRSDASFRHIWRDCPAVSFVNWPTFIPQVTLKDETLTFLNADSERLWDIARFMSLLLGEIPRLRDAPGGYGPNGAGFIAHVDIPVTIENAFNVVNSALGVHYGARSNS